MYSVHDSWFFTMRVSSFGNLRVNAHLQLTAAYRSLSRPSSAPDAKAFALCSCSLELPLLLFHSCCSLLLNCLSFINKYFSVINSSVKRFYPFCFLNFLSTFRWNCNFTQIFRKDLLDLTWLISYLNPFLSLSSYLFVSYSSIYFIRFSMNILGSCTFLSDTY